ncbi:MAG: hypothetical protein RMI56_06345 [Sulfolobales archaeon]|nr:hypothetical protein [Sulfolobales archaeon]MDW8083394.1 hypothetical protein [Sulfolobales archaeon]
MVHIVLSLVSYYTEFITGRIFVVDGDHAFVNLRLVLGDVLKPIEQIL